MIINKIICKILGNTNNNELDTASVCRKVATVHRLRIVGLRKELACFVLQQWIGMDGYSLNH